MTISHEQAAKQASTDGVVDLIDVGTTNTEGIVRLRDGSTTIVDLPMSDPAFGAADAQGEATANAITSAAAVASGTVDGFQQLDKDENVVFSGTAGEVSAITGVTSGAGGDFTVAEDLSALSPGDKIRVSDSTGNDGFYTVVSVSGAGPTTITVLESVPSATADGNLHAYDLTIENVSVNSGQTVSVSSYTYNAGEQ